MTEQRAYTKQQLVAEAKRRGYDVSPKLVERWVGLGLLDQAKTKGRGRGRGVHRVWPENQLRLFLTLLEKHQYTRSLRALTNVPVLVWLYWGEGYVPLRQVRRCLETYAQVRKDSPNIGRQEWANELVRSLTRPGTAAHAKQALADALIRTAKNARLDEQLPRLFELVVGPADPSAQLDGRRAYSMLRAQLAAITRFDELVDGYFRWARAFYLAGQSNYALARRTLAADSRFGHLHEPFDLQEIANRTSQTVLFILGLALVAPPSAELPAHLQLEPWLEDRAHLKTTVAVRRSPLLLPRGTISGGLAIDVQIDVDAAHPSLER